MIDYSTPLGQVRAMIPDTVESDFILSDDQINAYLAVNGDSVKKSVAAAWRAVAAETTLLYKYVKTDDLLVDGPKMAAELRQQAKDMDAAAQKDIENEADETFSLTPYRYTLEDPWLSRGVI